MELEYYFDCPYCGEKISALIDTSIHNQQYIEDCEVCCRPILIIYSAVGKAITSFTAIQQE